MVYHFMGLHAVQKEAFSIWNPWHCWLSKNLLFPRASLLWSVCEGLTHTQPLILCNDLTFPTPARDSCVVVLLSLALADINISTYIDMLPFVLSAGLPPGCPCLTWLVSMGELRVYGIWIFLCQGCG